MAFDEQGQAETVEQRVSIAHRVHALLTQQAGFEAEDIILDPNIFAIGTGIEEHNGYAVSYIDATRRIKADLPGVLISGGVSNVSFCLQNI
jgi:5-methyltetrahydrofolate--homocysteine methyltransferase